MANNQKKLKAFVRYDGSGRVVPSSLILRKNKPRVGRWVEIPAYECCNDVPTVLTDTIPGSYPVSYPAITLYCDESEVDTVYLNVNSVATGQELAQLLNDNTASRAFGTYSYSSLDPNVITLTVPTSVKNSLCPNGTLSFNIFED